MRFLIRVHSILFLCLVLTCPTLGIALPFQSQEFAVASPSPHSANAANEIAARGGNFVDQTVAVALALAVTHPYYASLGGGGFALLRLSPKLLADRASPTKKGVKPANPVVPASSAIEVLDFRETAPSSLGRDSFIGKEGKSATDGGLASGIPGVPAGLYQMHKKYGKIAWRSLFAPAIRLAEKGFPVSGEWYKVTAKEYPQFNKTGREIFSGSNAASQEPLKPGQILRQPKLASALKLLRDRGPKAFYEGPIGKDIVQTVQATGGVITEADLKSYEPVWRTPLQKIWRGYTVSLMPLPSSGGLIIAQALELMDRFEKSGKAADFQSAAEAHRLGEALKLSFAARGKMGDPGAGPAPNLRTELESTLLAPERLDRLAKLFGEGQSIEVKSSRSKDLKEALAPATEKPETTHFSMADRDGNAVAFTVTLNGSYGSGVVSDRYGIAMNDEMDDFAVLPGQPNQYGLIQGEANTVAPGSTATLVDVTDNCGKGWEFFATLGAPGGPRIASAVFQGLYRIIVQKSNAEEAVSLPRVHHQFLPDNLFVDENRWTTDSLKLLTKLGHKVQTGWIAKLYVVKKSAEGFIEAGADPRGEAATGGR